MDNLSPKNQFLIDKAQGLLSTKTQLNSFWQNIAYNFYPQRAFFTRTDPFPYGRDFASNLTTSFPLLVTRDLANFCASYLRPAGQQWFKLGIANQNEEKNISNELREWLEYATEQQFNFINDRESGFEKAMEEGDWDYTAFGNCVISVEVNWNKRNLLHRCWLMRDVAWTDGENGIVDYVCRVWKPTIKKAYQKFGDKLSKSTLDKRAKSGDDKITIFHIVMRTEDYYQEYKIEDKKDRKIKLPYVSIYVQLEDQHEIEIVGSPTIIYCISRDQTVSGSQYGYSKAVVAALPDARLLQSITLSLLEAGEKAVNPPIIAKEDAVRSDISLIANTISWVADSYDGKVDDALKVMNLDRSGLQYGLTMQEQTKMSLREAFYLNKLALPEFDSKMTATEVRQRIQEWIRNATPLFGKMTQERNQQMCKMQFDSLMHVGAFGTPDMIPDEVKVKGVQFIFSNPLVEAKGSEKGQQFLEMQGYIAQAINLDPSVRFIPDASVALRDALEGSGIPAKWLHDEEEVDGMVQQEKQQQQAQQLIQQMAAGGQAAESLGKGAQAINQAGIM